MHNAAQRDAAWSVFLAQDDLAEGGAVVSLIDWAWEADANEVDEQRLWLAAVTLTWFFSTSNRAVRDRATKALVNLLSCKLSHAADLLDQFTDIDDPYITERLLAACYGAAMQGMDRARCGVLAASVWKSYFAEGMGGFGGSLYHTTTFAMEAGVLKSFGSKTEFHAPSAEQLDNLQAR